MVGSILDALRRIKADVAAHLKSDTIEQLCHEVGHRWRNRVLTPALTIHAFLLQVLHGNTACEHVTRLMGRNFTGEAYCQARARLPLQLFDRLLSAIGQAMSDCRDEAARWCGHRVWVLDGSGCSMPDEPELQTAFGQPGGQAAGCGFPVAHLLVLFHVGTGMLQKLIVSPMRTHDMAKACQMHSELAAGDVLLGDRGLCSFAHLAQLITAGFHGVFRVHHKIIVDFRIGRMHVPPSPPYPRLRHVKGLPHSCWVKWIGPCDQLVEYFKPKVRPRWMTAEAYAALPKSILVRELRYQIMQRGYRTRKVILVTTLLDAQLYPAKKLAELYFLRWRVEVDLRHLKQTLHMDVLRSKTLIGIHKELRMIAIVYNLVRLVMLEAAKRQRVATERISFIDALRWLANAGLTSKLALIVNRHRPARFEPRVCKRRPKEYRHMSWPRAELRKMCWSND